MPWAPPHAPPFGGAPPPPAAVAQPPAAWVAWGEARAVKAEMRRLGVDELWQLALIMRPDAFALAGGGGRVLPAAVHAWLAGYALPANVQLAGFLPGQGVLAHGAAPTTSAPPSLRQPAPAGNWWGAAGPGGGPRTRPLEPFVFDDEPLRLWLP